MVPLSPDEMRPSQLDRRRRLVAAVGELVDAGADEDLQMKDIAEQANVAIGTVYRYFSSKDHLIAAALLDWAQGMVAAGTQRFPITDGSTHAERVILALSRAVAGYERRPVFARLLIIAANSPDPNASECYTAMGRTVHGALGRFIDDLDDDHRERVLVVIGAVFYHCIVEWTIGRMDLDDVRATLATAAHLVLPESIESPDRDRAHPMAAG